MTKWVSDKVSEGQKQKKENDYKEKWQKEPMTKISKS